MTPSAQRALAGLVVHSPALVLSAVTAARGLSTMLAKTNAVQLELVETPPASTPPVPFPPPTPPHTIEGLYVESPKRAGTHLTTVRGSKPFHKRGREWNWIRKRAKPNYEIRGVYLLTATDDPNVSITLVDVRPIAKKGNGHANVGG